LLRYLPLKIKKSPEKTAFLSNLGAKLQEKAM
jgi:hypothetical protein